MATTVVANWLVGRVCRSEALVDKPELDCRGQGLVAQEQPTGVNLVVAAVHILGADLRSGQCYDQSDPFGCVHALRCNQNRVSRNQSPEPVFDTAADNLAACNSAVDIELVLFAAELGSFAACIPEN